MTQYETYTFPVGMRIYDEDGVLQDPLTSGGGSGSGSLLPQLSDPPDPPPTDALLIWQDAAGIIRVMRSDGTDLFQIGDDNTRLVHPPNVLAITGGNQSRVTVGLSSVELVVQTLQVLINTGQMSIDTDTKPLKIFNLPTADPHAAGQLWIDGTPHPVVSNG